MLETLDVSSDIRTQVQSHGFGSVQARHYDRHKPMAGKRATLEALNKYLQPLVGESAGEVVKIRQYR